MALRTFDIKYTDDDILAIADATNARILSVSISAISQANPGLATASTPHGFLVNDVIALTSIGGMTQINNTLILVSAVSSTQFQLAVVGSGAALDTSGFGAYTSGGVATRLISTVPKDVAVVFSDAGGANKEHVELALRRARDVINQWFSKNVT